MVRKLTKARISASLPVESGSFFMTKVLDEQTKEKLHSYRMLLKKNAPSIFSHFKQKKLSGACNLNGEGRTTEKLTSFTNDGPGSTPGGGNEVKDGGGTGVALSPHPLFGGHAVSGQ
jgi:hypothetical protein